MNEKIENLFRSNLDIVKSTPKLLVHFDRQHLAAYQMKLEGHTWNDISDFLKLPIHAIHSRLNKIEWKLKLINEWYFGLSKPASKAVLTLGYTSKNQVKNEILNHNFYPGKVKNTVSILSVNRNIYNEICDFVGLEAEKTFNRYQSFVSAKKEQGMMNSIKKSINLLKSKGYSVSPPSG